ncbi:expressed unknown protein [Seminavis robusta]|uniref:Uncharacterized protein n=1 Tax=Seminavis robusta TaxID=568900 RepID=A0A9N8F109_9STRA|nr:expressed unknown protein [Seminavis robusta]|eukprot:Sro2982_g341560.1 n/a (472) ;mRNA; r:6635-8050
MRVWDEDRLLKQLALSRQARSSERKEFGAGSIRQDPVAFLLLFVRKFGEKHCEFLLIPASLQEPLEEAYNKTSVETLNNEFVRWDEEEEDMEYGVWIADQHEDASDEGSFQGGRYESRYVGKAIFRTAASGKPLVKMEGSPGWMEAMKQKYINLDAQSRMLRDNKSNMNHDKNKGAVKAVAAAALGGGAAAGGSSILAANAAAAAATASTVSLDAFGAGAFAYSGGFGAATQTAGTAGVVAATPVGLVAAAGAIGGLGLYYVMNRRNRNKISQEQEETGKSVVMDEQSETTMVTEDESGSDEDVPSGYQQVSGKSKAELEEEKNRGGALNCWVSLFAQKMDWEDTQHVFVPAVCMTIEEAERELQNSVAMNAVAKALFSPNGTLLLVETEAGDRDGWGTALALNYDFLVSNRLLGAMQDADEDTEENRPLLATVEETSAKQEQGTNWIFEKIRKKREKFGSGTGLPAPIVR